MSPLFRLIKDVDRTNKPPLKLRVVRKYLRAGFENRENSSYLEIVFHDSEGGRITAIVKKINLRLFENKFIEGRVYGIKTYYVENNNGRFKTSLAKFRIVFHAKTFVAKYPEEIVFPDFLFDFRDYATLVDIDKVDETLLFDIIGKVREIHNPQEKEFGGKRARLIEVVLEDLSGRQLNCTLWGSYVDEMLSFESNLTAETPVLILQMVRAKIYREKVTISSSFEVTQIITQSKIIDNFRSQLKIDDNEATKSISRGSLTLSRMEFDDLANGNLKCYPVDNVYTVDQESTFWTCAIVASFVGDWWYLACTRCHRKLLESGDEFFCDGCKKPYKSGVYRYKMQLEVMDSTANAKFLCWDREAEKLIGRSCHDLRVEFLESRSELDDFPNELAKLIDQTILFKVTVKEYQIHNESSVFTISRLSTDATLVAKYNKWTIENEDEADFLSLMMNEDNEKAMASDEEVTTPIKKGDFLKDEGCSFNKRKLNFEEECVGSNSGRKLRSKFLNASRNTANGLEDENESAEEGK
ncbi:hypothetical protein CASFOL_014775 [Castilleja foliolosa]|uniref:Uncharacterized protein n=1 Tax=Castilleja foliolosa TaxID=1961234 RepID=A0ABD3DCS3_9LAMI